MGRQACGLAPGNLLGVVFFPRLALDVAASAWAQTPRMWGTTSRTPCYAQRAPQRGALSGRLGPVWQTSQVRRSGLGPFQSLLQLCLSSCFAQNQGAPFPRSHVQTRCPTLGFERIRLMKPRRNGPLRNNTDFAGAWRKHMLGASGTLDGFLWQL